jgi:hypothetical protein
LEVKMAISIPDAIFEEAERLAKMRGWSRSELYANAVSAYINSEKFLGVREKLDAVYAQNIDDPLSIRCSPRPRPVLYSRRSGSAPRRDLVGVAGRVPKFRAGIPDAGTHRSVQRVQ